MNRGLKAFVFYIGGIFLAGFLNSCMGPDEFPVGKSVYCDAETVTNNKKQFVDPHQPGERFMKGPLQSDLEARSGEHSALTHPKNAPFAFKYTIKRAGPDWYFVASVWRKSKDGRGVLVAASKDAKTVYQTSAVAVEKDEKGWEKLALEFYTPPNFSNEELSFYVWNNSSDSVYFDDLRIERQHRKIYPDYDIPGIALILDTSDMIHLFNKRKKAFEVGVLQSADDDWVRGILFDENDMMKVNLRLKGDWLDHLMGDKWSFRIKMRKDYSWNRLRTFSVQTPLSRDFLVEWVAHQMFDRHDVLTTRYGFTPLIFNNKSRGIYAWEEHFDKQLLEWRYRREGPIVKFSEDAFWQMLRNNIANDDKWRTMPFYEAAVIKPFKVSRTTKTPVLKAQFLNAQRLMYQYKYSLKPPGEIFDLDKMARYHALMDLLKVKHGLVWHNQRYYFNPVLCKLEPIAFDAYSEANDFFGRDR